MPFAGREEELRLLWSRWERVVDGEGQVVLITGEAGIGKSRLVEQFHERLMGAAHNWVECASAPYFENTPFYPVADMLQQFFGWHDDESTDDRLKQLERNLELGGLKFAETIGLIAPLLSLPIPENYPPIPLSPEQQRTRLMAALAAWTFGAAKTQPTVIVLEDPHWVDPSTIELTQILVEQGATAPLLLLYTARPEFRAPWPMRAHHSQVTLNRLSDRQTREMVARVSANAGLSTQEVEAVVKRATGVPLFVEELTRAVVESGEQDGSHEIPATLHDSLMARLDRLGPAKDVAQIASVIGREFSYELLAAVSEAPEDSLQSALAMLSEAELIYARGIAPEATYQFKHALIQDAAYEALLKSRRKELHRRVAETLEKQFPATVDAQPALLAQHWTEAGETEIAVVAWGNAAKTAVARNAYTEAEQGYGRALSILRTLDESPQRDAFELDLTSALIGVLYATKPWSAPELVEATARATMLAEKSNDLKRVIRQNHDAWVVAVMSGDNVGASALADRELDLAQREGSSESLAYAHGAQIPTRFWRGDLVGCDYYFLRGVEFFEKEDLEASVTARGVGSFSYAAWNAWTRGFADTARARSRMAISAATESKRQLDLALALFMAGGLHCKLRAPKEAEKLAARAIRLDETGLSILGQGSRIHLGWARAQQGDAAEGVELIRQGIKGSKRHVEKTEYFTWLAEALALDGAIDDAFRTVEEALAANPEELVNRPEAFRVRGELRLSVGQRDLAETDFHEAITLAQKIDAKAWELRSTASLARLLRDTNRRDEARAMLAQIYNWFTEGFDTADLKDAKALLGELGK